MTEELIIFGKVCKRCHILTKLVDFDKGKQVCKKCRKIDCENDWYRKEDMYEEQRTVGWNSDDEIFC